MEGETPQGGDIMADNECTPDYDCREYFKEAVCIDAQRVYDSCSECY